MEAIVKTGPAAGKGKKLLEQMRDVMRLKHYSYRTERTYCDWVERYIRFHGLRHPREMAEPEAAEFLTHLAREGKVAASTQNQALSALLFLYKQVLKQEIGWLQEVERAKNPTRLPVVLTRDEVHKVFAHLQGTPFLMASLLYWSGLRLMECVRLRVKDLDFGYAQITVREGKGAKDRVTMLPVNLAASLERHLQKVKAQHGEDVESGLAGVHLPHALARKYPRAEREWAWQWVFPSSRVSVDPRSAADGGTGVKRRHHVEESALPKQASGAKRRAMSELGRQLRGGFRFLQSIDEATITDDERSKVFETYGWTGGEIGRLDDDRVVSLARIAFSVGASQIPQAEWRYPQARLDRIILQLGIVTGNAVTASGGDREKATKLRDAALGMAKTTLLRARFYYSSASRDADKTPELAKLDFQPRRMPGKAEKKSATNGATTSPNETKSSAPVATPASAGM